MAYDCTAARHQTLGFLCARTSRHIGDRVIEGLRACAHNLRASANLSDVWTFDLGSVFRQMPELESLRRVTLPPTAEGPE